MLATALDEDSVARLDWLGAPAFYLVYDWSDLELVAAAARTGKPIVLQVGTASEVELAEVIETARKHGSGGIALVQSVIDLDLQGLEALRLHGADLSPAYIKLARRIEFNPVFVNISFVGASALAKELGPDGKGVIVSQVVPFPWDASLKVVAEYQAAIKAPPDFVSLEGYLVGRLTIAALEKAGPQPTREGLLKIIKQTGKFDIGGLVMTYGPTKNEGLDDVFLTVMQPDGTFKPVEKLAM